MPASELRERPACAGDAWSLDALAGRFVEISGSAATATLTAVAMIVLEAQRRGRLAVWIGDLHSSFFPPDFAALGIDLRALPVVHAPEALSACRAADQLIRAGGFAVVVLDCGHGAEFSLSVQTRLAGLAKQHHAALVWITRRNQRAPRSSLVSLRVDTERRRTGVARFTCEIRAVKDKHAAPGWTQREVCRGTDGLC
jgi:recombination protein RecA